MGSIEAICISKKKGIVKEEISEAVFIENHGIEGDAHAGNWHRQVSLLAVEDINRMKKILPNLQNGAFAENIITNDLSFDSPKIGDRYRIGDSVLLEVTQIGKKCHTACAIGMATGDCIMPKKGVFARVLRGGNVRPGNKIEKALIPANQMPE